jgi:SAM-dependent methyltransferase
MPASDVRPCPACLGRDARGAGTAGGFRIRRCRRCQTLFTDRLPTADEGTDYAAYYHPGNLDVPAFVRERLGGIASSFDDSRRTGRWLDVGCGAGALLAAARDRGWDVTGTEVAEGGARAVRERGFDVRTGELDQLGLPEGAFDVVSIIEVIEHVPEPRSLLAAASVLLRRGGVLYLTTPNGRGLSARLLGTRWSVVSPPEHLQLFSRAGMRLALAGAGLRIREMRTHAVNPNELLRAVRVRQSGAVGGDERVASGYRLNAALSQSRSGAFLKSAANAVLSVTRLGDSLKVVAEWSA